MSRIGCGSEMRPEARLICIAGGCLSLALGWLLGSGVSAAAQDTTPPVLKPYDGILWSVGGGTSPVGTAWAGQVAADGTLNLGTFGTVQVAGLRSAIFGRCRFRST